MMHNARPNWNNSSPYVHVYYLHVHTYIHCAMYIHSTVHVNSKVYPFSKEKLQCSIYIHVHVQVKLMSRKRGQLISKKKSWAASKTRNLKLTALYSLNHQSSSVDWHAKGKKSKLSLINRWTPNSVCIYMYIYRTVTLHVHVHSACM